MTKSIEEIAAAVLDTAFHLHKDLGPGLLETVYEQLLAELLRRNGFVVDRQVPVNLDYLGIHIPNAHRIDMLVDTKLVLEIKSCEGLLPVHSKQLLTYLRLTRSPLGLLINFGAALFKDGVKRLVNNHSDFASSRLRAHQ